eukprot:gene2688-1686_t
MMCDVVIVYRGDGIVFMYVYKQLERVIMCAYFCVCYYYSCFDGDLCMMRNPVGLIVFVYVNVRLISDFIFACYCYTRFILVVLDIGLVLLVKLHLWVTYAFGYRLGLGVVVCSGISRVIALFIDLMFLRYYRVRFDCGVLYLGCVCFTGILVTYNSFVVFGIDLSGQVFNVFEGLRLIEMTLFFIDYLLQVLASRFGGMLPLWCMRAAVFGCCLCCTLFMVNNLGGFVVSVTCIYTAACCCFWVGLTCVCGTATSLATMDTFKIMKFLASVLFVARLIYFDSKCLLRVNSWLLRYSAKGVVLPFHADCGHMIYLLCMRSSEFLLIVSYCKLLGCACIWILLVWLAVQFLMFIRFVTLCGESVVLGNPISRVLLFCICCALSPFHVGLRVCAVFLCLWVMFVYAY